MVDLLTRAANLLVFFARVNLCGLCLLIFIVILVFFSCFPPPFLLKQLWAFISLEPPRAFVVLQAFPEFEESTFLLAGATFICILGLEVLFFNNGILFLFQPPSRLLRTCFKHHYGPPLDARASGGFRRRASWKWWWCFAACTWILVRSRFCDAWRCFHVSSHLDLVCNRLLFRGAFL